MSVYPARFDYHEAVTVDEAISLLTADDVGETRLLAGGQGLVPDMKVGAAAPDVVVDISAVDGLDRIERVDGGLAIGALVTHADVVNADRIRSQAGVVAEAAAEVADYQIRNRGTVGGNLAEADPEADLPAAILATGATVHAAGPDGRRAIPADEFFAGPGETALTDDELLVEVRIPHTPTGAYVKRTHPARGYAMVGVAATFDIEGGTIAGARIVAVGVTDRPTRLRSVESELAGMTVQKALAEPSAISRATDQAADDVEDERLGGDAYASGEFRAAQLPSAVTRAVRRALGGDSS